MRMTEDLMHLTEECKKIYENADSLAHRCGHIKRTADGAVWFVKNRGGTEREQELAYAAGLLHDIRRKRFNSKFHAMESSLAAPKILKRYSFTEDERNEIIIAVRDHSYLTDWKSLVHQSVYLSDKILELMGAYLDFRAPFYIGEKFEEVYKIKGVKPLEAILSFYQEYKNKIFIPSKYPDFVGNFVNYQMKWNLEFVESLENNKEWAIELGMNMFECGRKRIDFEKTIMNYEPNGIMQKKWADEMQSYVKGSKFKEFEKMITF
ncbi:MAG: HD domain-containing protein [Candidatus Aenigmatarchaeota archaeon]